MEHIIAAVKPIKKTTKDLKETQEIGVVRVWKIEAIPCDLLIQTRSIFHQWRKNSQKYSISYSDGPNIASSSGPYCSPII